MAVSLNSATSSLISGVVCLTLIVLSTLPAIWRIYNRFHSPKNHENSDSDSDPETRRFYADKDGTATEETEKAFNDKVQKSVILVAGIAGFLVTIVMSVLGTLRGLSVIGKWGALLMWFLILVQATALFLEPNPTRRFMLGIHGAWSALLLAVAICVENVFLYQKVEEVRKNRLHATLSAAEVLVAVVLAVVYTMLPRRPDVLRNGTVVDQQYSVSLLDRYGFSWPGRLMKFARDNRGLDIKDLAELDYDSRAETLQQNFHSVKPRRKLWMSVYFAHEWAFIQQWILVVLVAVTQFAPHFALLKILRALEARVAGEGDNLVAWLWVLGLGVLMVVSSWIESWLFWVIFSRIGVPLYEQLSAVIFMKAMRRKDVKGTQKGKVDANGEANGALLVNEGVGPNGEDSVLKASSEVEDEEEDAQKTRQSTINLVGVDSRRVSEFATFNYLFLMTALKLLVAFAFLISLIGWKALLAGLAVSAIATPVNVLTSKKYSDAQGDLMKTRDQKMAVVTEALQGIRQIKFSALEPQWQDKIGKIRATELTTQWRLFSLETILISIWILGPVMLSAVSLAVYAALTGGLSASVAFTTISVFSSIEMTLAVIPELTTEFLDAWVSIERIEKFLKSPEKVVNTVPADSISYENASIAWPAEEQDEEGRYVLRNLSISFPDKELSVISGKTGCGKSLLLSSILGECDVLAGVIKVPKAPSLADRHDDKANGGNWIIDSAIAYVAQIPWIENATIKDNILFGLPMDPNRYKKVLSACALEKDLEMLPDGELTDIGANGINLSGGQRWRVTFARALYSRAGILVLDDVFSAVDAHVGRHLYEEALTGELGRGRTRVLVTHHVALCLPRTKYMVVLGDGTVEHAGLIEDLKKSGSLTDILQKEEEEVKEKEKENEEAVEIGDGEGLQKMLTNISRRSRRRSTISRTPEAGAEAEPKLGPKKFIEEEKRETGAIKYTVYREYFSVSGGFWFWSIVMVMFAAYIGIILGRVSCPQYLLEDSTNCFSVMVDKYLDKIISYGVLPNTSFNPSHLLTTIPQFPHSSLRQSRFMVLSRYLLGPLRYRMHSGNAPLLPHLHRLYPRIQSPLRQPNLRHPPCPPPLARYRPRWPCPQPLHCRFQHDRLSYLF
jgi:ABC-type multidrug transport system fused ATPase/permease subunit